MSLNLAQRGVVECDGDGRWPCRLFVDSGADSMPRETRRDARQQGWETNVRQRYTSANRRKRRLDFCPTHRQARPGPAAGGEG